MVCYLFEHDSQPFNTASVQMQDGVKGTRDTTQDAKHPQGYISLAFVYPYNPLPPCARENLKNMLYVKIVD